MAALTVSLFVHAALIVPWLTRPIELGDGGGASLVNFVEVETITLPVAEPARVADQPSRAELSAAKPIEAKAVPPSEPPHSVEPPPGSEPLADAAPPVGASDVASQAATPAEVATNDVALASIAAFVALAANAATGAPGDSCKLGAWLQEAMQENDGIAKALHQVPRQTRSVANAVMLWNGQWVEPVPAAAAGVTSLQRAILAGIQSAPPQCLRQPVNGPLLIAIQEEDEIVLLAIGSGQWRWADLLAPEDLPATNTPRT